jgi:short/branched chain acyl-CoA dehydrogenase
MIRRILPRILSPLRVSLVSSLPLFPSLHRPLRSFSSVVDSSIRPPLTELSEDEEALRSSVEKFAQSVIAPKVHSMDSAEQLDLSVLDALFSQGLMGIEVPAVYQGSGMTFFQSILAIEELAKIDPAISVIVDIQNTLINTIINQYASQGLKEKYLPLLANHCLGSFCLSESGSGSDAFALKTRAVQNSNGSFTLNGTKLWISNAAEAKLFLIFANLQPEKGYKGISCFLAEREFPGLIIGKKEKKLGIRASSTCELTFDQLVVPKENIVGQIGEGYKIAIGSLNEGRIGIAAQMLGLAQGVYTSTLPYIHQRKQFGKPIAEFQGMQFSMAEIATRIEATKLLVYNAARLQMAGKPFIQEASMAKLYAAQTAEFAASRCIEMCGGVGFTRKDY